MDGFDILEKRIINIEKNMKTLTELLYEHTKREKNFVEQLNNNVKELKKINDELIKDLQS